MTSLLRFFFLFDFAGKNDEHKIRETFWYSENHKLYGVLNDPYILCLMTSSVVPTPSVR